MKLGILETGNVPDTLEPAHGTYPEMFEALYRAADPTVSIRGFAVTEGVFPDDPHACDAWLVTGSKHGVYDDLPWIEPLKVFLREARAARVPLIGICFGHQIMAEAFGGRAVKSDKGWGCGVHDYSLTRAAPWMPNAAPAFSMHAMHQDQVVALAPDAHRLATSPFCENAMVCYGDPDAPDAISIQPHPEFAAPYAQSLVEIRAASLLPKDCADQAMTTFGRDVANLDFARWSLEFVRQAQAKQKAA